MGAIKRSLIIGDVHGCYHELLSLLKKANYNPLSDQLYFVGDLINKGPQSREVLEFAYNFKAKVVLGNHELGLVRIMENNRREGRSLEQVKLSLGKEINFWIDWINHLPSFIETEDFFLVHAGKIPERDFHEEDRITLCTIRYWDGKGSDYQNPKNDSWYQFYQGEKPIVYGHHALEGLVMKENVIGLDTGCVYGNKLSAISFPDRQLYQVNALRQYFPTE